MGGTEHVDPLFEQAWRRHPLSGPHSMPLIVQSYKEVAYHFWHMAQTLPGELQEEPVAESPVFEPPEHR